MTRQKTVVALLVAVLIVYSSACCWATDTTPPTLPALTYRAYCTSTDTLYAAWTSTDCQSGILRYEYVTSTTSAVPTEGWVSTGTTPRVTVTGLGWTGTHYIHVRAFNNENMQSSVRTAEVLYETTVPSAPIIAYKAYSTVNDKLYASWSASADKESGVAGYEYAYGTSSTPPDPGSGWTSTTSLAVGLSASFDDGVSYYFHVKAKNGVSQYSDIATILLVKDTGLPGAPRVTASRTAMHAGWDKAGDSGSGIASYEYAVGESASYPPEVFKVNWTPMGASTWTKIDPPGITFTEGTPYYVYVRATDNVGNAGTSVGVSKTPIKAPVAWEATYECIGIYWCPAGGTGAPCTVTYTRVPGGTQKQAMDLWYDERSGEYRGSIVNLTPGTSYSITLTAGSLTRTFTAATRSDVFPVGVVEQVDTTNMATLHITSDKSGTPTAYRVIEPMPGANTIDAGGTETCCVQIDASYVILRNFKLQNAAVHGIVLGDVHDVVIEGCEITGWGDADPTSGLARDCRGAVYANQPRLARITVQRNKIHSPRHDTNSWEEMGVNQKSTHPQGPQAVVFFNSLGGHVIRYNEVYASEIDSPAGNYFNDCFGAGENFSYNGFPAFDTDIYGNYLGNCWDDAIESEGANSNVRIWGNFMSNTMMKVAVATTSMGPVYVWRNVGSYGRWSHIPLDQRDDQLPGTWDLCCPQPVPPETWDSEGWDEPNHGGFLKAREDDAQGFFGGGKIYVFNNTMLQPPSPGRGGCPAGSTGAIGCGLATPNLYTSNNIFDTNRAPTYPWTTMDSTAGSGVDYDFYDVNIPECMEPHGTQITGSEPLYDGGTPSFALTNTNGLLQGSFALSSTSVGHDGGVEINNFTDGFDGLHPDMGAHEAGSSPMDFGTKATRIISTGGTKLLPDGALVNLKGVVVTAVFDTSTDHYFYVEQPDRSSGVRVTVDAAVANMDLGDVVNVSGAMGTTAALERHVVASRVDVTPDTATIRTLGMNNRALGGGSFGTDPAWQRGVTGPGGLNNIGLLVQIWGRVSVADSSRFYVSDGGLNYPVRVDFPYSQIQNGDFVKVTGISTLQGAGSTRYAMVLPRSSADIVKITSWDSSDIDGLANEATNVLAMPGIPDYSPAAHIFVSCAGQPPIYLSGALRRFDPYQQVWVDYLVYHGVDNFGACLMNDGFVLDIPANGSECYKFSRVAVDTDQWISLPKGSTDGTAVTFIGNPFNETVYWSQCSVTNGSQTLSFSDAMAAGWLLYVEEWSMLDQMLVPAGDYMTAGCSYVVHSGVDNLALIVPDPSP